MDKKKSKKIPRSIEMITVGYFLSRFIEDDSLHLLNVSKWKDAYGLFYDNLGDGRGSKQFERSLKNTRDAFDSHIENSRSGWFEEDGLTPSPLTGKSLKVYEKYSSYSPQELLNVIKEYIGKDLADSIKNLNEKIEEKEIHIRKNAAITGNKAEMLFKEFAKEKFKLTIIKDLTDEYGYGYDFLCEDENKNECYVEIKGCKEGIGSIRMTQNEWNVAREKNDQYILVIVFHIYDNPQFKKYVNPFRLFKNQIELKEIKSVTMHINKEDLI